MIVDSIFLKYARRSAFLFMILFLMVLSLGAWQVPISVAAEGPKGPVEITVGSSAGGTPDIIMRRVAKILNDEKIVEQPIVIQNRAGGSWTVAANWVLGKKGGYDTLLAIAQPVLTTPIVQGMKNTIDQVVPIAVFVQGDLAVLVQPDAPFKSLSDFIEAARKNPRGLKFAGAQVGGTDQMVVGLLEKATNVKFNYIPYDGGGAATAAFLGRNVDGVVLALDEALPLLQSNKVKALAVLSEKRRTANEFKDVPTAKEQGINLVWGQFWGLAGAPGMEPALAKWWSDRLQKMVATKSWKEMVDANFQRSEFIDYQNAGKYFDEQYKAYLQVLRDLGLSKQ